MATATIQNENTSRIINVLAGQRGAVFDKVWSEGGRDFTVEEQGTLDHINGVLLRSKPKSRDEAGAVLETAIEQLQLFTHGETSVDLAAVQAALFGVLSVLAGEGDYKPAIFRSN